MCREAWTGWDIHQEGMCIQYVLHKGWCCAINLTLGVIPPFYAGPEIQPWALATIGLMGLGLW